MSAKLLFYLPSRLEPFIAAVAAVQSLDAELHSQAKNIAKKEKSDHTISVVCDNKTFEVFNPVIPSLKAAYFNRNFSPVARGEYDLVARFDERLAYKFGRMTHKHMAQVFGVQIGSDPANGYPTVLPDFSKLEVKKPECDILFFGLPDELVLALNFLGSSTLKACMYEARNVNNDSAKSVLELVSRYRMIVGVRSAVTYLASAFRKPVVEIYPTDMYENWLSKWANPNYQMIYQNVEDTRADMILRAMEAVWARTDSSVSMAAR